MNIIITGATSGIGKATAILLLNKIPDAHLWLIGRRREKLEALKEEWSNRTILISELDVKDRKSVEKWREEVSNQWDQVDLLINNAGLALGVSPIQDGNIDAWDTMIDTNVKGLLYISRAIIPMMISKCSGHIINIGSTAGKVAYENGNVYCATKYAVDAIGQSMRIDLLPYNIKVTNVNPGMVVTEFSLVRYDGDKNKADKVYNGYKALTPEDVADVILYCAQLPAHVCVNDITLTCTQQANSTYKKPLIELSKPIS